MALKFGDLQKKNQIIIKYYEKFCLITKVLFYISNQILHNNLKKRTMLETVIKSRPSP